MNSLGTGGYLYSNPTRNVILFSVGQKKPHISSGSYGHSVPLKRIIYKWRSPTFRDSLVLNHKCPLGCRDLCLYGWLRVCWVHVDTGTSIWDRSGISRCDKSLPLKQGCVTTGRLSHERLPGCLVLSLERISFLGKIHDQKINVKKMSDEQNCHNHFLLTRDFQIHERKEGTGQTDIKTIESSLVEKQIL